MIKKYSEMREIKFRVICLLGCALFCFLFSGLAVFAADAPAAPDPVINKEKQIVEINHTLKNVIEENDKLIKKNKELGSQFNQLKTENMIAQEKYNNLQKEHEDLAESVKAVKSDNRKYNQEIKRLEQDINELEERGREYTQRTRELQEELVKQAEVKQQEETIAAAISSSPQEVHAREEKAVDLLSKIDAFNEANEELKNDSAKAHYNMGNIYFQKGEYELAAREYYQAVTLLPNDPDSHFNLAFIASEYLQDYDTSLEHFKMYLYLTPNAKDKDYVSEKILEAQMHLRSHIDSPLDREFK